MSTLRFDVPGISPVGLKLIALLNNPDVTAKQIAVQARLDPVIYGNIIACANSPLYAGVSVTTDILASLVRLGQREIKRIVYQVVLRAAFFHEIPAVNALMRRIWMQGLTTNLCMQKCVSVASHAFELSTDELEYLSCLGLVHNIGYVVLLINFQNRFLDFFVRADSLALQDFFNEEHAWFNGFDHFTAGRAVLKHWNFPRFFWKSSLSTSYLRRTLRVIILSCMLCCV